MVDVSRYDSVTVAESVTPSIVAYVRTVYDDFVDLVDDLLSEWGSQNTIFIQPGSKGIFNPLTGAYEGATSSSEVSIKAIFTPVSQYMVDNTAVLASDVIIKVSPKGLSTLPVIGDKIRRGGDTYTLLNPRNVKPGDTDVILVFHARKD